MDKIRRVLNNDKTLIQLTDLGAGSRRPAKSKTVSQIAKTAVQPTKYQRLLFRLIKKYEPKTIVELGTNLGLTTNYLAAALGEDAVVYSLEGDVAILDYAKKHVLIDVSRIKVRAGNFDTELPILLKELNKVDLIYIDGNHTYEATMRYFTMVTPYLSEDAILIFDDIYWSAGMTKAWEEIKSQQLSQTTVDIFKMGLVFVKPAKVKQHFRLKF